MLNRLFLLFFIGSVIISNISAADGVLKAAKEGSQTTAVAITEFEKQQKILEQYKPLIKPRTYDDLLIYKEEGRPPLTLNRLPGLEEAIIPERPPNILLIPYLLKSFAHPAYSANYNGVDYFLAVNCEDPKGFDDCSTTPHNRFTGKKVYVKFIQSNDKKFNAVNGMRVGQRYSEVQHLFSEDAEIHGDGECLQTITEWLACFDATNMAINKKRLQMMPAKEAQLLRFIKIKGKAY